MIPGFYFSDDHGDNVVQHERPTAGVGVLPVPGLDLPSCVLPMLFSFFIQETDGKDSGEDDSEFWEGLIRNRSYNSFHTKSVWEK